MGLFEWIGCLVGNKKRPEEVARLRAEFKANSHNFKLLLAANNQALEHMSEIEAALNGTRPFEMNFVRSRSCRIAACVYQIVRYLNDIAPGRYEKLYTQFDQIQKSIVPYTSYRSAREESPAVLSLSVVDRQMIDQVGNKMANLGELKQKLGLNIPEGFVVTASGFRQFMGHDHLQTRIDKIIGMMSSDEFDYLFDASELVSELIENATIPPELESAVNEAYTTLDDNADSEVLVAVRSSSPIEDLPGMSMAGQYRTELAVKKEEFFDAYKKVVASKYSYQSMVSRVQLGIRDEDVAMCVGVMPMVDAAAGGVVYTADPLLVDEDVSIIYSVHGLPTGVVDGTVDVDRFVVSKQTPAKLLAREIAATSDGSTQPSGPSLKDNTTIALAEIALRIESYYELPQDIEWALDGAGELQILQSRPLTRKSRVSRVPERGPTGLSETPPILEGGVAASSGLAHGEVFVVRNEKDVRLFPSGAVLVASQALPFWAVLLSRASAVVTSSGNVAGHLASVSREAGVPALMGVQNAHEILTDGQMITVDADERCIYSGKVGSPTSAYRAPTSHLEGSRVFESLKSVAKHIIPLHLLDPDSTDFRQRNCATFHDITRFCHEKSVKAMFQFGSERTFPEHASRQLFVEVPMQFWVIDLEDGFAPEAAQDGKFVRLENVASIPMQALWKGMTAVPWEGPPAVDAAGFLSVMYESTTNPELLASQPSEYTDRNYFMVTKNFCSLQSRFGYHFSTVEAHMGNRNQENYLRFVFKGGAADIDRRVRRARLVGQVLEAKGISCRLVEDSVSARMENCDDKQIAAGLLVVGFLTMHTRQLDMVMNCRASVEKHRIHILEELEKLNI